MHKLTAARVAFTGLVAVVTARVGWQGVLLLVWVAAMAVDYLTGSAAALKAGTWSSAAARKGLWHKAGSIAVVLTAALADIAAGVITQGGVPIPEALQSVMTPLVTMWYLVTELGSITENAAKLGAPVPEWLRKRLEQMKEDQ